MPKALQAITGLAFNYTEFVPGPEDWFSCSTQHGFKGWEAGRENADERELTVTSSFKFVSTNQPGKRVVERRVGVTPQTLK